jgi:hypothetical protein
MGAPDPPVPFTTAAVVNPDAGAHRITADPRELEAARAAGERTWTCYPYYAWRYGERGRRFTLSDSAWIATLAQEPDGRVAEQVAWLGVVLASRGMPRRLLEVHLGALAEELTRAVPDRAAAFAKLGRAGAALADARRGHLDDAALAELSSRFDEEAGSEWSARLPRSGEILASAVADERGGIGAAVTSLEPWFAAPERFPPRFVAAVTGTLAAARAVVR